MVVRGLCFGHADRGSAQYDQAGRSPGAAPEGPSAGYRQEARTDEAPQKKLGIWNFSTWTVCPSVNLDFTLRVNLFP